MTLDTSQRREGYASRSSPASEVNRAPFKDQTPPEMEYMTVGAHEHREAAIAICLMHCHRGLAVLVRAYKASVYHTKGCPVAGHCIGLRDCSSSHHASRYPEKANGPE